MYNLYNNQLRTLQSLDFDDLLIKVNELFYKNPEIVKKWALKYSYILVDEFQDTSAIQYEIIKLTSAPRQR
ncbi:UvrD-helicase domain-containing protein [Mycoplasmopsis bovis]|uniref:UvrD-helicase domain-containing protein n=1 Tax=Mycoplasmopsis bovis TaxID=28903 RepID=UPI003D2BF206